MHDGTFPDASGFITVNTIAKPGTHVTSVVGAATLMNAMLAVVAAHIDPDESVQLAPRIGVRMLVTPTFAVIENVSTSTGKFPTLPGPEPVP